MEVGEYEGKYGEGRGSRKGTYLIEWKAWVAGDGEVII
jgi:hypothetical protein